MEKKNIVSKLIESKLDLTKVWVLCGGAMVMHGAKKETCDIDLGCESKYFSELEKMFGNIKIWPDGMRSISIGKEIEIFENWNIMISDLIEGINVSSINDIIKHKQMLNREKDRVDLDLLYKLKSKKP